MIEKIDDLIRQKGLSQAALERSVCLSQNRISKWKDEKGEPTARQALRIARFFNVPVEYLIDDELDAPPQPSANLSPAEQQALRMVRAGDLTEDEVILALSSAIAARSIHAGTPATAGRPAGSPAVIGVGHPVDPRSGNPLSPPSSLHDRHSQDPKSRRGAAG
jgi:transcriptional regulator with XRE-family HTH domain